MAPQCEQHMTSGIACEDRGCFAVKPVAVAEAIRQLLPVAAESAKAVPPGPPIRPISGGTETTPERPIRALSAIYKQQGLKVQDVAVYSYLWHRALGKNWPSCWPSQPMIAKACHMRRDSVKASLDRLQALGAVTWVRIGKASGGWYNRYTLHPPSGWGDYSFKEQSPRGVAAKKRLLLTGIGDCSLQA